MTVQTGRFSGRRAVITGAASGVGFAAARLILAEGGAVALFDLDRERLDAAIGALRPQHSERVDVTDPTEVISAMQRTVDVLGGLDILITSAGVIGMTAPVVEYPFEEWRRVFAVNVDGVFHCCQAAIPYMQTGGYGRIVTVASIAGKEGNPNASAYSASKGAVIAFTKSLGKELALTGIRANTVTPGAIRTPMLDQIPEAQLDYMASKIPVGRLGTAEECASLISFVASEDCSFSTGSVFDMSGGRATY